MLLDIALELFQFLIVALGAALLVGAVRKMKARLQGRRGASVLQPYYDLRKLCAKEAVISENTSWVFRFTPYLLAATMLLSATDPLLILNAGHLLAFVAFFIVALAETGRLPVDNPSTPLELTMIHEAMILEYSGGYLALVEWAAGMKLLFLILLANLFFPWGVALTLTPLAFAVACVTLLVEVGMLAAGIALLETAVAKLRLFRVPELLSGSFTLALLAVVSVFFAGDWSI